MLEFSQRVVPERRSPAGVRKPSMRSNGLLQLGIEAADPEPRQRRPSNHVDDPALLAPGFASR